MILKGQKVTLRPVRLSDAERFVKWFSDPEVNKFMSYRNFTLAFERRYIKYKLKFKPKDNLHFCIDTKEGVHIGSCSLESISNIHKRATFGIIIGEKKYWNQGLGSEAARIILDYGFTKLKLHRIDLDVYAYNPRAIKVYKRLGFKVEGKKREHAFWNKKFYDAYQMSILDREWKK
ncbi:MAG: GNAT family protein [Candidatus Doudnabacteria bacterium]|jgi:RimJ/RimL family protein N-acetyltransferase